MKNNNVKLFLIGLCLLFLAGCTSKSETSFSSLSSSDQKLVWVGDRSGDFGTYSYKQINTLEEAQKILKDKFSLSLPGFYTDANKLVTKNNFLNAYPKQETSYNIEVNMDSLDFYQTSYYGTEALPALVKSVIHITYVVDSKAQQVKTTKEQLTIETVSSQTPDFYKALPDLSKQMAAMLGYKMDKTIDETFAKNPEKNDSQSLGSVEIFSKNNEEKSLKKDMSIGYDNQGFLTQWDSTVTFE